MDNGAPGKKPPARSTGKREPTGPATLGNMRSLGPHDLDATCKACGHRVMVNTDSWPDEVTMLSLGPRIAVYEVRAPGANLRADWSQMRRMPGNPRS